MRSCLGFPLAAGIGNRRGVKGREENGLPDANAELAVARKPITKATVDERIVRSMVWMTKVRIPLIR